MSARLATIGVALLALGCGETFAPESRVEGLRVLGIRADPPEIRPGASAALSALVVDPKHSPSERTTVWVGCDPDPFGRNRSACADTTLLQDGSTFVGTNGELPPGVHLIGLGDAARYTAPANLFNVLPADDARRQAGVVGQVLALVVGEAVAITASQEELKAVFERVRAKQTASVLAMFRLRVSEASSPNQNPGIDLVGVDAADLKPLERVKLSPGTQSALRVSLRPGAVQSYLIDTPSQLEVRDEVLVAAFYATAGSFTDDRLKIGSETIPYFGVAGTKDEPAPENRQGSLWTVLRDSRGGQSWTENRFFLCDDSLPEPLYYSVLSMSASTVEVRGEHLGSMLDARWGDAVGTLEVSPDETFARAVFPVTVSGPSLFRLVSKTCRTPDLLRVLNPP